MISGLDPRPQQTVELGERIYSLLEKIYPVCRSITGNGVRETLRVIGERIPLETFEVPSGTRVLDWQVPKEWNVRGAYISDSSGRRVVDFARHNLHLVSYSVPVRARVSFEELKPHLHSLPDHPDWIPYRTSYYREDWGFCLRHADLRDLKDDYYEVVVDTTLEDGSLTYAECFIPGEVREEVLIYTHVCHPSLANDNASGIALVTVLAEQLLKAKPRYSYRCVFAPGTIGSITWLARNEETIARLAHGLVVGLVGDPGGISYKCTRAGDHVIDRAARHALSRRAGSKLRPFTPYGYDERQFSSPGFKLPVGRLTRSAESEYAEYHTSADNLSFVDPVALGDSLSVCLQILAIAERDAHYVNLAPKGEPQLGRRGLYRAVGGTDLPEREFALLWVLNQSDGETSLLGISERSGLPFETIAAAAAELEAAELLRRIDAGTELGGKGRT